MTELPFKLPKFNAETEEIEGYVEGKVVVHRGGIEIFFENYGTKDMPKGSPIWIEHRGGKLSVSIWNDINGENPIEINMETAKEENHHEI